MTVLYGTMTVDISNGKSIKGSGKWESDTAGQIWFDYASRPYPSSIDWRKATSLTFEPSIGKTKHYSASETSYFFNVGWTAPRLVLQKAHRF